MTHSDRSLLSLDCLVISAHLRLFLLFLFQVGVMQGRKKKKKVCLLEEERKRATIPPCYRTNERREKRARRRRRRPVPPPPPSVRPSAEEARGGKRTLPPPPPPLCCGREREREALVFSWPYRSERRGRRAWNSYRNKLSAASLWEGDVSSSGPFVPFIAAVSVVCLSVSSAAERGEKRRRLFSSQCFVFFLKKAIHASAASVRERAVSVLMAIVSFVREPE